MAAAAPKNAANNRRAPHVDGNFFVGGGGSRHRQRHRRDDRAAAAGERRVCRRRFFTQTAEANAAAATPRRKRERRSRAGADAAAASADAAAAAADAAAAAAANVDGARRASKCRPIAQHFASKSAIESRLTIADRLDSLARHGNFVSAGRWAAFCRAPRVAACFAARARVAACFAARARVAARFEFFNDSPPSDGRLALVYTRFYCRKLHDASSRAQRPQHRRLAKVNENADRQIADSVFSPSASLANIVFKSTTPAFVKGRILLFNASFIGANYVEHPISVLLSPADQYAPLLGRHAERSGYGPPVIAEFEELALELRHFLDAADGELKPLSGVRVQVMPPLIVCALPSLAAHNLHRVRGCKPTFFRCKECRLQSLATNKSEEQIVFIMIQLLGALKCLQSDGVEVRKRAQISAFTKFSVASAFSVLYDPHSKNVPTVSLSRIFKLYHGANLLQLSRVMRRGLRQIECS